MNYSTFPEPTQMVQEAQEKFGLSSLRKRRYDLVESEILRDGERPDDERHIIWELTPRRRNEG